MAIFVVQRHQATTLHYDLRLEIDGVLVSWAVPRGPSMDPADKRLAIRTDDHELAHADVEGATGPTRTGRPGSVVIWDTGEVDHVTRRRGIDVPAGQALADGHLRFSLHGVRLFGDFALTQTRLAGQSRNWLLVKVDDGTAQRSGVAVTADVTSVMTGLTNAHYEQAAEEHLL